MQGETGRVWTARGGTELHRSLYFAAFAAAICITIVVTAVLAVVSGAGVSLGTADGPNLAQDAGPTSTGQKPKKPKPPPANTPAPVRFLQPPALTSPTTVQISESNRIVFLEDGRDYIVKLPADEAFSTPGGVGLIGGRNVVIVGGEIFDDSPIADGEPYDLAYGIYLEDQTGTVHIEGVWIHGRGIGQSIALAQFKGATVQILNSRLAPGHPVGYVHTDGIQSWGGPTRLIMSNVTIRTSGVGIQTQPHSHRVVTVDRWEFHRVNVVQTTKAAYALWKAEGHGDWWRQIQTDLWVKNLGYLAWPSARHWNPGGPARVEGSRLKRGLPPKGDFVQARIVGHGYARARVPKR